MRLELQKQTLECKQEMKQVENKGAATVAELQEQLNETLQEEEKLKALNDSLREEVETRKKAAAGHSKANPKAPVIDPEKLLEAAKNMEVGKLQYMQYQIYLMLNGMYKMYPQPGYYPYQGDVQVMNTWVYQIVPLNLQPLTPTIGLLCLL
eukprot:TRINITY_DN809_c1_g1_i2.p4 TRINITY_DN809_c1_g1~~TRINITY_DN809_c1_g1_i2.p4  ORF type:complete len:151 (+),score=23.08 TRINITY_DN809_c1_g1_i2:357-809(+)